jgi:hypothetical protein
MSQLSGSGADIPEMSRPILTFFVHLVKSSLRNLSEKARFFHEHGFLHG